MNTLTLVFIATLLLGLLTQAVLVRRHTRHIRANRDQVPPAFLDRIPLAAHQKAADYTCAKARLGLIEMVFAAAVVLFWTVGGGLEYMDLAWRTLNLDPLWTGVGVIASVLLIGALLDIPSDLYRTFRLEQRYGFNRMTAQLYVQDLLKEVLLAALIGLPMLTLVLWIMMSTGHWWWLLAWAVWLSFSVSMMWAYPAFIAPWFNKFRPLENPDLKQRIERLLERNGFASRGIFVMDGSSRSTHGNAYFTGLGANKRIVFFDTLIGELSPEEIEAVLAHELGHFKCGHIHKRIGIIATVFFIGLALLGWLIDMPWFYEGLGVSTPSPYMGLALFLLVSPAFTFFLQPLFSWISRQHEFEADDFAAGQAQTQNLAQALVKLYRENANTLTPDPAYSAFHDSHPPAPIRIAHLAR